MFLLRFVIMGFKTLATTGLLAMAASLSGIMAYEELTKSPTPRAAQKRAHQNVVGDLVQIVRKYGTVEFEQPIDPEKPFFLYVGQIHGGWDGTTDKRMAPCQVTIYLLLREAFQKNMIDAAYFEGFMGGHLPSEDLNGLRSAMRFGTPSAVEAFVREHPHARAFHFLRAQGFDNLFGYFSTETFALSLRTPPSKVGEVEGRMKQAMKEGAFTTTIDEISKYCEVYGNFAQIFERNSRESLTEPPRIARLGNHRNIAVVAGVSHAIHVRRLNELAAVSAGYNLGFVQLPISAPESISEPERIQTNLERLREWKKYMEVNKLSDYTFQRKE